MQITPLLESYGPLSNPGPESAPAALAYNWGGGDGGQSRWCESVARFVDRVANQAAAGQTEIKVPELLRTLKNDVARSEWLYLNSTTSTNLFHRSMVRVKSHLDNSGIADVWLGSAPANGIMDIEATTEFYRLWSALGFLFNMREVSATETTAGRASPQLQVQRHVT